MVEDQFHHHYFIIDVKVGNDDRTMRAVLKNPSRCARGQFLKSSKIKHDEEIPVLSFLVDISHCVNVVDKHIYSITLYGKAQRCGYKKSDAIILKNDWGYL